ncbi:Sec62/63 complex, subunit Sec66 [Gorgonomyces haynaldii]|nr:Sec62/63 complex, subunit Sec66 [Gorgonomyces haynaldii]
MAIPTILLPVLYVGGLAAIFYLFARYQKSKRVQLVTKSKYFEESITKLEYEELSEQYSLEDAAGKRILEIALMRRACEDVERVLKIREEKPQLAQMVQNGIIGEELLDKLVHEADMYRPQWGKTILQEASQFVNQRNQLRLQQQMQQQQQEQQEQQEDSKENVEPNEITEERRKSLVEELIREEEEEKLKKK